MEDRTPLSVAQKRHFGGKLRSWLKDRCNNTDDIDEKEKETALKRAESDRVQLDFPKPDETECLRKIVQNDISLYG